MRRQTPEGRQLIVVSGFDGPELPAALTGVVIARAGGSEAAAKAWRLDATEGSFTFKARAVEIIDEQPSLYEPLHHPFALSGADRFAVRILLWMLRLPGGARLLRRWHAGRSP